MPRPIAEQVVVITGASSGIGRCTALHLAARGARVVVTARRAEALESLVREIEAGGGHALAAPGDVTREEDLREVAHAAVARFGRVDTWVNCASVYIQGGVDEVTLDEFRRVLEVNLVGLINGTRCALEVMLPRDAGVIVQVSSVMGRRGAPFAGPYSTAKSGIEGFCDSLRSELWGTGIQVCTLYPPTVDTPIYHHARGKWGVIPKPPPPIEDPEKAARVIAGLAERPRVARTFGPFGYFYLGLAKLPARWSDWFLHHAVGFTFSTIPEVGDNLDRPAEIPPRIRAGWAEQGWKGVTLRETTRVLPWESVLGALAAGFVAGRLSKRLGRGTRDRRPH